MFDTAAATLPDFTKMTLDDAKSEFMIWSNATWDFTKKLEAIQRTVQKSTSVKHIQRVAIGAVASGLYIKGLAA